MKRRHAIGELLVPNKNASVELCDGKNIINIVCINNQHGYIFKEGNMTR